MAYRPTKEDRDLSAIVQLLAIVTLLAAPWWASQSRRIHKSPYLAYWVRVSAVWSILVTAGLIAGVFVAVTYGTWTPFALTLVFHALSSVMGALAAASHTRFQYFFVGRLFCRGHMERAWPELIEYDPDLVESLPPDPSEDGIAPPAGKPAPTADEIREMYPE